MRTTLILIGIISCSLFASSPTTVSNVTVTGVYVGQEDSPYQNTNYLEVDISPVNVPSNTTNGYNHFIYTVIGTGSRSCSDFSGNTLDALKSIQAQLLFAMNNPDYKVDLRVEFSANCDGSNGYYYLRNVRIYK